jgi:1-acyl-sn-glycerol-3-phosphate acyltransferase
LRPFSRSEVNSRFDVPGATGQDPTVARTMDYDEAHRRARENGANTALVRVLRIILVPFLRIVFGMRVSGRERVPATGAGVIAPNHKSFWDGFFIVAVLRRDVRFMGKSELFRGWRGRFLLALGAFPVRRGASDSEALDTARAILANGELLALFPEGTRVRDPESLGVPKRGAARLALETGAPLIPTAITGTERRRLHLPRRVQVSFGQPIAVTDRPATPEAAAELVDEALWPTISEDYRRLRARPGLIAAGIAAVGIGVALNRRRR